MQNLIDLISDAHLNLRREAEERWGKIGDDGMSHTETHLLARIGQGPLSISEASRLLNISRQAMQKCAVNLEERGYLLFSRRGDNRREKYMSLTERGNRFCLLTGEMKQGMEREIAALLGEERVRDLKDLLEEILSHSQAGGESEIGAPNPYRAN